MHSTFGPAFGRGHLSRHERQELARAEAFSRRTASIALVASPRKLAVDELELIRRLVRHDRTAVSTALLVIAGIGRGESRREAVLSQLSTRRAPLWLRARSARAEQTRSPGTLAARSDMSNGRWRPDPMRAQSVWGAGAGERVERLFASHARQLQAVVSRRVRTSRANIEDACGFAWLQLVRRRPEPAIAFPWLCTTAVREAIKLDRKARHVVALDAVVEVATDPFPERVELIAAAEQIRAAGLRPRESRVLGLRCAGYARREIAELTGASCRTVDRQLVRAQRRLRDVRLAVGEAP